MQVEVPYPAEVTMRAVEGILHGTLVGLVIAHDAVLHLVDRELAGVDRLARVEHAPDEADAPRGLGAGDRGPGPGRLEERGIDVEHGAIRVDVAAREARADQRGADVGARGIQLVHVAVLGLAQRLLDEVEAEVVGILVAAVRGIEHEGHMALAWFGQRESSLHGGVSRSGGRRTCGPARSRAGRGLPRGSGRRPWG